MSYWVSIHVDSGPDSSVEAWSGNYTSNCSWMWTEALALPEKPWLRDGVQVMAKQSDGDGGWEDVPCFNRGLRLLDLAPCSEAAGVLARGAARMRDPELAARFRAGEPANGWGDYETAAQFLEEIAAQAARHSLGTITVSS